MRKNTAVSVQANLFRGMEAVGGILTIISDGLLFQPHKLNVQSQELHISLSEIESISEKNTLGLIPNGMIVNTKDGQRYKFALWDRSKIIGMIRGLISP